MKKEYDLKKMKVKSRGAVVKNPRDAKVKISKTVRLDGDLVSWLVSEGERTGIPYQTLMNAKLREAMTLPDRVKELVEETISSMNLKKAM